MKISLKQITPPFVWELAKCWRKKQWDGDFSSWDQAAASSSGYQKDVILKRAIDARRAVINGHAEFERDTVLFAEKQYNFPVIASFLMAVKDSQLSVVDFGGALGSTYHQNRTAFKGLRSLSWTVVEQKHFVDAGKKDFATEELHFEEDLQCAVESKEPQVLFSSSTLQYLQKPLDYLERMVDAGVPYLLLDRIGFHRAPKDRITLETVPRYIYDASYPCWFFAEPQLLKIIERRYELVWSFDCLDSATIPSYYKGFFFKRR